MKRKRSKAPSGSADGSPDRPLLIGWKEYLDFPEWKLRRVKVKVDTGARTSAIGALSYELIEVEDQGLVARLRLAPYRRHPERIVEVEAPVLRMVVVRNSACVPEERPLIEARIRLGPVSKRICLTVADRRGMLLPMILGRQALVDDFIVDVSRKYVLRSKSPSG